MKPRSIFCFAIFFCTAGITISFAQCPEITVSCGDGVKEGEVATFTVKIKGGPAGVKPTYEWITSSGRVTGQGTEKISVATASLASESITATVIVNGFDRSCQSTASCRTGIRRLENNTSSGLSAIQEIDEKKEIMGIKLLAPPDYSQLKFLNTANDYSGNVYTLANNKTFKGSGYELSEAYILVNKGVVAYMWCVYPNNEDGTNIINDFSRSGLQVGNKILNIYFGQQLTFLAARTFNGKKCIAIQRKTDSDSLPDVKDNSGILALIGKNVSDPAVQQFIAGLGGKCSKAKDRWVWRDNGVDMWITKDQIIYGITFYLVNMEPYTSMFKLTNPYKGSMLPYQLTSSSTPLELIDKFGRPDDINFAEIFPAYKKLHIRAEYTHEKSVPIENKKLIAITVF